MCSLVRPQSNALEVFHGAPPTRTSAAKIYGLPGAVRNQQLRVHVLASRTIEAQQEMPGRIANRTVRTNARRGCELNEHHVSQALIYLQPLYDRVHRRTFSSKRCMAGQQQDCNDRRMEKSHALLLMACQCQ